MFKKTSVLKIYAIAASVMAVAMAVAQTLVYRAGLDPSLGLWAADTDGFIKALFYILSILALGFALSFALTARHFGINDKTVETAPVPSAGLRAVSLVAAALLVATVIAQFLAIGSDDKLFFYYVSNSRYYSPAVVVIHTLTLIAAIPTALWFVSVFMKKKVTVAHGIAPVLYLLLLVVRIYFDTTYHLNNPRWSARIFSLVVALLFFLFEVRQLLPQKRLTLYHLLSVSTTVILTVYSLSSLALNLLGVVKDGIEMIYDLFLLSLGVYALLRTLKTVEKKDDEPEETPSDEVQDSAEALDETAEDEAVTEEVSEETPVPEEVAEETPEETLAPEEAAETEDETEEETEEDLPDLTEDEVKRFLTEMTEYLAEEQGADKNDQEAYRKAGEQALYLLSRILEDEDRNARISAIRGFLAKRGA